VLRDLRYDMVLHVTCYVAIRAPGLTILLSFPYYYITTYCITLGYTTTLGKSDWSGEVVTLDSHRDTGIPNEEKKRNWYQ
jgi:hypothetical protein